MRKVLVEKLDEQFVKRFDKIRNLEESLVKTMEKTKSEKEICESRKLEIWRDIRRRYGLENVISFSYSPKDKKLLSSNGSIFVNRVEDKFVERLNELIRLGRELEIDINFVMSMIKIYRAEEDSIFYDLMDFYELRRVFGIFEYDAKKKQLVLIEDLENFKQDFIDFLKDL